MKKRKNWKIAVGVVCVALIGVGVTAGISKGFTSWDIKGNFTKEVENKPVVYESHELFKTAFEKNKAELDNDTLIKKTEVVITGDRYLDTLDILFEDFKTSVSTTGTDNNYNFIYLDNNVSFQFDNETLAFISLESKNYVYRNKISELKGTLNPVIYPNLGDTYLFNYTANLVKDYFNSTNPNDLKAVVKQNDFLKKISIDIIGFGSSTLYLTNDTINLNNYSFEITNTNYEKLGKLVDLTTAKKYMKIIEG